MIMKESAEFPKKVKRILNDFFVNINKYIPDEQKLIPSQVGINDIMMSLLESSFFNDIAKRIFYNAVPETQVISKPEAIIGIIVGLSLMNTNLVRTSLLKLLGQTKSKDISGLFAILSKDPNLEKDIKAICKTLKVKPDLVLNLVDVLWTEPNRDRYNPLMKIWGDYCSASNVVSALVSVFKGDLSWSKRLSERFEVNNRMLSLVLSWACKRNDLLKGNFSEISTKLRINNEKAVEFVLEVACGNIHKIKELEHVSAFKDLDLSMITDILELCKNGIKMRKPHNRFEIPDPTRSLRVITDKLKSAFNSNAQSDLSDINGNDFDDLTDVLWMIVNAVWGSPDHINNIADKIVERAQEDSNLISSIWTNFPQFKVSIVKKSFDKIFNAAENIVYGHTAEIKQKLSENSIYLEALKDNKYVKIDFSNGNEEETIKQLRDQRKQLAYKVGWTVNIAGNKEMMQSCIECQTWYQYTKKVVKICLSWAEFWHAGHELKPSKDQDQKFMCCWGANIFPNCPVNDKGNPLEKVDNIVLSFETWSLLNESKKVIINSKNNFKINPRLIKRKTKIARKNKTNELHEEVKEHTKVEEEDSDDKDNQEDQMIILIPNNEEAESSEPVSLDAKANMYYDEVELKEKFEEEFEKYDSQEFIVDLINTFKLDLSDAKESWPKLYKNKLYLYDESLCRHVHFYEHIILIAQGLCRPGLISILSCEGSIDDLDQTSLDDSNKFYSTFMWLIYLLQGNYEYFLRHCRKFLKELKVKRGSGSTIIQKAARLLMLCHSFNHYTEINEISGVRDEYQKVFMEIFPKKYKMMMLMHKLAWMDGKWLGK